MAKTGFNLDYAGSRDASRRNADAIIKMGELEAQKIQSQDRGLERGLGAVAGFALGGPLGALAGQKAADAAANGDIIGAVSSASNIGSSGGADTTQAVQNSPFMPQASGMGGQAIDPAQLASSSNRLGVATDEMQTASARNLLNKKQQMPTSFNDRNRNQELGIW